jgi:hypothetical protein
MEPNPVATTRKSPLHSLFAMSDSRDVATFLNHAPFLEPLLRQAHERLEHYFPGAPQRLAKVVDPEITGDVRLVLDVVVDEDVEPVMARLSRFDREWWLAHAQEARGKLTISVYFS